MTVLPYPGEHLSADEAMCGCATSRNSCYTSLDNAGQLVGFRYFSVVDYETKVCISIHFDNKEITTTNGEDLAWEVT